MLKDLMDGSIGRFWADVGHLGSCEESMPGFVRLADDGDHLLLDLLAPGGVPAESRFPLPRSITATTSAGGALFLDVRGVRGASTLGGYRVATRTYRAGAVVFGVQLPDLLSDEFREVTAFFPGVGRWAGLAGSKATPTTDEQGRMTGFSLSTQAATTQSEQLGRGRTLGMSTHWEVQGPEDRQTLYAPVSFSVASERPADWSDLIQPLLSVQGLISLAYDGLVLADGGRATIDLRKPPLEGPKWWTARLMQRPRGARIPRAPTEIPTFFLQTLGGMAGVRRWVGLTRRYPRATGPLLSRHRYGDVNVETQLLEIAAGIEYWVTVHRRTRQWANRKSGQGGYAGALAAWVGAPFANLVGDPDAWARRFWTTYGLLKHQPNGRYDGYEVSLLAGCGAVLLECALLNRAARTAAPARAICDSHRHVSLGARMRELLGIET
ncbi:hypothetical protein [Isoptericola sp. NPDC019571]|uniref:ApeA N-terminal domain 1-containing protein n=1 Tax=Isoptericola sp. NPDC019571 TaxID=3364008 RepID=UPI00378F10D7